jgi:riboflavin synthase
VFTGIIETKATLIQKEQVGSNIQFTFESELASQFRVDQSIAHNGVCLTVIGIQGIQYTVVAIDETLRKTNLGNLQVNNQVNIERCMPANGRFDGHIVQGHVDTVATCVEVTEVNGSWLFTFELGSKGQPELLVDKGSICINGISLTIVQTMANQFQVAIIPYTYEHTTMNRVQPGTVANIEYDIVGKYIRKMLSNR